MKPGDTVIHKYTGTKFVVLSVKNGYARVQTKPGQRTWVFPVGVLRVENGVKRCTSPRKT